MQMSGGLLLPHAGEGREGSGGPDGNASVGEGHCCQAHHNTMADAGSGADDADVGSIMSQPGQKNERCTNTIHDVMSPMSQRETCKALCSKLSLLC